MKIAALLHYYIEENRAGGEMMAHRILKELAKEHDVTAFITRTARMDTEIDGVKLRYASCPNSLLTCEWDYVFTHFENAPQAIATAHELDKRVIYIAHNDMSQTARHLNGLKRDDIAIYNTEWIRNKYRTRAKQLVIHPPCTPKNFETTRGNMITLVNLTVAKGALVFYELAKRLPHEQFLVVGGGYFKNQQIIKNLRNVTYQPNTSDMKNDVYARSKIVLMPSDYETYGMVAREAGASGIPVICTPTDGLVENLGDAGVYVDFGDVDGYVDAIQSLKGDKYTEASEAIKERVNTTYQNETSQLLNLLRRGLRSNDHQE